MFHAYRLSQRLHPSLYGQQLGELYFPENIQPDELRHFNAASILSPKAYFELKKIQFNARYEKIRKALDGNLVPNLEKPEELLNKLKEIKVSIDTMNLVEEVAKKIQFDSLSIFYTSSLEPFVIHSNFPLGEGTYGTVFLCISLDSGEQYAVKILRGHNSENEINALKIFDTNFEELTKKVRKGKNSQKYKISLHWGKNLHEILYNEKTKSSYLFPLSDIVNIFDQIITEINDIHEKNFIHCDIKLTNVMWDPAERKIKIVDYGFSRELSEDGNHFSIHLMGTPFYLGPELFSKRTYKKYNATTDFYAIGIVFLELLTRKTQKSISDETDRLWQKRYMRYSDIPRIIKNALNDVIPVPSIEKNSIVRFMLCHLANAMVKNDINDRPSLEDIKKTIQLAQTGISLELDKQPMSLSAISNFLNHIEEFEFSNNSLQLLKKEIQLFLSEQQKLLSSTELKDTLVKNMALMEKEGVKQPPEKEINLKKAPSSTTALYNLEKQKKSNNSTKKKQKHKKTNRKSIKL